MTHDATNGKAPGTYDSKGLTTDTNNTVNSASEVRNSKALSTLLAQLALRGYAVHQLRDGGYLVSNHRYSYRAGNFASLRDFAQILGVS